MARARRITLVLLFTAPPAPVAGQTLVGRVLDQVGEQPLGGAMVALVARTGEARDRTVTGDDGRFTLTPPEPGEYLLTAELFGYATTRSPLFALTTEGEAPVELLMSPVPIGLEGLDVTVEELAAEELDRMGLSADQLGNRWIERSRIDAIPVKRDLGTIVEHTVQAGVQVIRPENANGGSDVGLCVSFRRATRTGRGTCALIVLDGVPISSMQAADIDPEAVESMALLEPREAATLYGTLAGGGAVLVWTRRGR
jgi:hypothetical protein